MRRYRRRRSSSGLLGADDARVRREACLALELIDLDEHLVERRLDRIEARLREVGEIALGGRARRRRDRRRRRGSFPEPARASLMGASCSSVRVRSADDRFVGRLQRRCRSVSRAR